ncbi:MAG TPA: arylsulfotransferase family protein [Pseudonocardiaceae bacterium]|jgi:hypothetical protein|nr:arylsulfotransferase family protein [Pseudonocardiaceae bacterium]
MRHTGFSRRTALRGAGALGLAAIGGLVTRPAVSSAAATTGGATTDVAAPRMTVNRLEPGTFAGQIFFTFRTADAGGVEIADTAGTPVWSTSGPAGYFDFQAQTYRGRPVLTWWQGGGNPAGGGTGTGIDVLTTFDHAPVATIGASGAFQPDIHELRLTPQHTALITSYVAVPYDLSSVGGPADGQVLNSYCEEVDIASGQVLHRWSALDHVPLTDSYVAAPTTADEAYDFFHINSISITPDDHLLISARHTCALYKINRSTGQVVWRLGGKSSSFAVAPDAVFGFQHHASYETPDTIRLFDDGSDGLTTWHPSRVAWLRVATGTMTATLAEDMSIPGNAQSAAMGSAQRLPNGNVFVSWGSNPRLSEFSPRGDLLFDATLDSPSYRAFKYPTHLA